MRWLRETVNGYSARVARRDSLARFRCKVAVSQARSSALMLARRASSRSCTWAGPRRDSARRSGVPVAQK